MLANAKQFIMRVLTPFLLFPLAAAAQAQQSGTWREVLNMTPGVTEVSRQIYDLHMIILWICVAIGTAVFAVMFYSVIVHRKSRGYKAANFHESTTVEIIWTVVPALILVIIAIPATKTLVNLYDTSDAELDVKVTGYQWRWQYEYLGEGVQFMSDLSSSNDQIYNREEKGEFYLAEVTEPLVIPVDTKVRFLITANDVIHSWWMTDFGVKKDAIPGYINETWARVDKTGVYRGYCAELCGQGHAFMPVVVHVVEKDEFAQWLDDKKAEAETLRELASQQFSLEELMERGEGVHNRTCSACHQTSGEGIAGVFPPIKGSALALGPVEDHMNIVVNGSPGTAMQAFGGQLSEVDIAAVLTYQRNAWGNDTGDVVQPVDVLMFKQGQ
ncbi:MAG: cytochrome c oxidase subunit II [Porticoccaceae bacterium]|nr:cytochrome c oxidase subunit II [Porticoccaceae bacterium]